MSGPERSVRHHGNNTVELCVKLTIGRNKSINVNYVSLMAQNR